MERAVGERRGRGTVDRDGRGVRPPGYPQRKAHTAHAVHAGAERAQRDARRVAKRIFRSNAELQVEVWQAHGEVVEALRKSDDGNWIEIGARQWLMVRHPKLGALLEKQPTDDDDDAEGDDDGGGGSGTINLT